MTLIEQIIADLTDSSKTLADPLLKTKVLASRIKNTELYEWTDRELTGYKDQDAKVPYYRIGKPVFYCTMQQGYTVQENTPLPIMLFPEKLRNELFVFSFDDSVKTLESQAKGDSGDLIGKEFGVDMCSFLTSQIINNREIGIRILHLRVQIHISAIIQVLSVIRSKLLDFMLKIEEEIPDLDDLIKQKLILQDEYQSKMNELFHQTIIYAAEGNTITTGNSNVIQKL